MAFRRAGHPEEGITAWADRPTPLGRVRPARLTVPWAGAIVSWRPTEGSNAPPDLCLHRLGDVVSHHDHQHHDDIIYPEAIPFLLVHLACLAAFWTGITREAVVIGIVLYVVRMWAITAGFHRYFSHRSFKTSRVFQFLLAFVAQMSAQQGALWWAAKHRQHHKHSDTEHDVHSPGQSGFWFSHVGWIFSASKREADYRSIPDLMRYPELVWLDRHHKVPALALAVAVTAYAGWPGLIVGFFWSTVVLYHCTFFINSLAHVVGKQRYVTGDDSRNNWWLALITLGEGWHNNHHHFQASTRQGFRWWEIDITFYVLKAMSWVGLVWDLKAPPEAVVRGDRPLPRPVVEKVAAQLANSFATEAISSRIREAWAQRTNMAELRERAQLARQQAEDWLAHVHLPDVSMPDVSMPDVDALRERAANARAQAEMLLADLHLPELPTLEDVRRRAQERLAHSPSLDEIAERARQMVLEMVSTELFGEPVPVRA